MKKLCEFLEEHAMKTTDFEKKEMVPLINKPLK